MTPLDVLALAGAGVAAGTINTIVGSGSLISFPTLVAIGYPPVVANITNTVGLVPGSLSGAIGYRRELTGQRGRIARLGLASVAGGLTGGILLLVLPERAFEDVVPFLILGACLLVAAQPRLAQVVAQNQAHASKHRYMLLALVYLAGIYGGYFGAAQGVILVAILGIIVADDLQRLNGLKNVLVLLVNGVAAALFILFAQVAWDAAILLGGGAIAGGQMGALVGRRLPNDILRVAIVVIGTAVGIAMLVG